MDKMRVMWFTNTPSLAGNALNLPVYSGGWIESLEMQFREIENIELAVVFETKKSFDDKKYHIYKTTYYPVKKKSNICKDYLDIISEFRPDIIQIFGTEKAYGEIIKNISIPVVIHIQGVLTPIELKKGSFFTTRKKFKKIVKYNTVNKPLVIINNILKTIKNISIKKILNKTLTEREIFQTCKYFIGRTSWDKYIVNVLSSSAKYFHCDEIQRQIFYQRRWSLT
jgi:hypothetical protein